MNCQNALCPPSKSLLYIMWVLSWLSPFSLSTNSIFALNFCFPSEWSCYSKIDLFSYYRFYKWSGNSRSSFSVHLRLDCQYRQPWSCRERRRNHMGSISSVVKMVLSESDYKKFWCDLVARHLIALIVLNKDGFHLSCNIRMVNKIISEHKNDFLTTILIHIVNHNYIPDKMKSLAIDMNPRSCVSP